MFAILVSVLLISLISLVGVVFLALKEEVLDRTLPALIAFASGGLLGGAFLHLLPESLDRETPETTFVFVLSGIVLFFITEKFLYWRHCHEDRCEVHSFAYMNLVGDGIHNFIDGLIIASSYMASMPLGIAATLAIIFHEIPQEIGDFGVLVYGGVEKLKALFFNFLSALTAVLGALVGYFLGSSVEGFTGALLPFAAGGFIYIASTDLMPELHKRRGVAESVTEFTLLIFGIFLMWLLKFLYAG